jgi:hypothetical protein
MVLVLCETDRAGPVERGEYGRDFRPAKKPRQPRRMFLYAKGGKPVILRQSRLKTLP